MWKMMIKVLMIVLTAVVVQAGEFHFYGGIADSQQEYTRMGNPLGYLGVNYREGGIEVYMEHISSIPNKHDYGLNIIGVNYVYEVDSDIKFYCGFGTHNFVFDNNNNDYGGEVEELIMRAGIRYKWMFIEQMNNIQQAGVRIEF